MSRSEPKPLPVMPRDARAAQLETALAEQKSRAMRERDAEREAIARELHDSFGQYLTMMELELSAAGRRDDIQPDLLEQLDRMRSLTRDAQQEMADRTWQIRPVSLQGMDLKSACTQLIEEWSSRSALSFDLHIAVTAKLPARVETTLYRVLQEAVTNAVKHANAARIGVILRMVSQEVVLIVEDDGNGFAGEEFGAEGVSSRSLGLLGIRERLDLVGGTLEIESTPDHGATLLARVPL